MQKHVKNNFLVA